MGSSFPVTTNKALIQFGKQMKASHSALGLIRERDDNLVAAPIIYPTHRGLLPCYTGHVPGTSCFLAWLLLESVRYQAGLILTFTKKSNEIHVNNKIMVILDTSPLSTFICFYIFRFDFHTRIIIFTRIYFKIFIIFTWILHTIHFLHAFYWIPLFLHILQD